MGEATFTVDSRNKILSILNGLHAERAALSLTLGDSAGSSPSERRWRTSMLKVLPEADHFFISTLGRPAIDQRLRDGESFALKGSLRGVRVIMDPLAISLDSAFSAPDILAVPIPDRLLYLQKRDSVRLSTQAWGISVRMAGTGGSLSGQMDNLSFDGCGILFQTGPTLPASGEEVALEMTLPEESEPVTVMAVMCHASVEASQSLLGFHFVAPDLRTQNIIDRFVLRLQRESCKSRRSSLSR